MVEWCQVVEDNELYGLASSAVASSEGAAEAAGALRAAGERAVRSALLATKEEIAARASSMLAAVSNGEVLVLGDFVDSLQISGFDASKLDPGVAGLPNFATFGLTDVSVEFGPAGNGSSSAGFSRLQTLGVTIIATEGWTIIGSLSVESFGVRLQMTTDVSGRRSFGLNPTASMAQAPLSG